MSDMAISRQLTGLHPPTEYVSNSSGLRLEGHVLQRALTRNRHFAKDAKSGAPAGVGDAGEIESLASPFLQRVGSQNPPPCRTKRDKD
jgi:hypothetical protein